MSITRMTDFVYAFRLLALITKPWIEQEAYKYGIIDANGNAIRKWRDLKTGEERDSYTYFHRIAFNMKRMLQKVPGFNNRPMTVAAALRLLKEEQGKLDQLFEDEEIAFIGQKLLEDTPTNATGDAVSTNVERPLQKKQKMVTRAASVVSP